jgi:hypothetical protein
MILLFLGDKDSSIEEKMKWILSDHFVKCVQNEVDEFE